MVWWLDWCGLFSILSWVIVMLLWLLIWCCILLVSVWLDMNFIEL